MLYGENQFFVHMKASLGEVWGVLVCSLLLMTLNWYTKIDNNQFECVENMRFSLGHD